MGYTTEETKLAEKCIAYLKKLHEANLPVIYDHRSGSGGFNYKKGSPDLWACIKGQHLEIELKAPDGKLSSMQETFKWRCENVWGIPYLCPRTFEEFKEFIDKYLETK